MRRRRSKGGKARIAAVLCVCFCMAFLTAACASGVETDEEGGVWDYNSGIYTDPSGQTHQITPDGVESTDTGTFSMSDSDGGMIVGNDEPDPVLDPNGGLSVESGDGTTILYPDATRPPLTEEEWEQRLQHAADLNGSYTPTVYRDPATGVTQEVEVVYMGIGRSMVVLNGVETLVNTVDLKWQTEAPEDKVLAVIDTPKNGYAAMYAGKSKKTTLLKQCRLDQVVRVISTGNNWTLVDHEGTRGYVRTSSLEFFLNDHVEFEPAVLSVKGRTKGHDSANIRSRDKTCRVLCDYELGTPLTVFDIVDEWAEIDVCGWHCRINSRYLTLLEPETTASAK